MRLKPGVSNIISYTREEAGDGEAATWRLSGTAEGAPAVQQLIAARLIFAGQGEQHGTERGSSGFVWLQNGTDRGSLSLMVGGSTQQPV